MAKLGKIMKRPFAKLSPKAIIRYFMYLPLNFIPVVGTAIFIILQGRRFGPNAHARYFQLKQMNAKQQEEYVKQREAAYTRYVLYMNTERLVLTRFLNSFGVPATLLEMVPVVGIFFAFTNTVGAALWAADLEQRGTTAPGLRDQAKKAE